MVNKNLLRGKIASVGMTQQELSKRLGMSKNTISAKINGKSRICLDEVDKICEVLGISDSQEKAEIFLLDSSQFREELKSDQNLI